jgi:4-hydroxy-tetrahydrodipicolinate synthase
MGDELKHIGTRLSGVFAALVTPIDELGRIDLATFERVIDFAVDRGMDGVVIGGGTGEYAHFDIEDRARLAAHTVERMRGRAKVFTSVGTSSIHSTLRLARRAADAGSEALLLPMPYFFRYEQQDLQAFCEEVCRSVSVPCLLYNLPSFTNRLEVDTAIRLLSSVPNLIGLKDSSGEQQNFAPLVHARASGNFSLFVGDDGFLLRALEAGWDGVISGIACFAPELIAAVYRSYRSGNAGAASRYQAMLDELIEHVVRIPIPWGVRVGLAARGIPSGPMHVPPSPGRLQQIQEFQSWLPAWAAQHGQQLGAVWSFSQ